MRQRRAALWGRIRTTLQSSATFLIIPSKPRQRQPEGPMRHRLATAAAAALMLGCGVSIAAAQTPEQFYKGRQLSMIVFSGPGSTYDVYARLLVRHLGNHIPG